MLAILSSTSTPPRIEQTKEEEAAILPYYLGCLFQNISFVPRNTKYIFKKEPAYVGPNSCTILHSDFLAPISILSHYFFHSVKLTDFSKQSSRCLLTHQSFCLFVFVCCLEMAPLLIQHAQEDHAMYAGSNFVRSSPHSLSEQTKMDRYSNSTLHLFQYSI